MEDMIQMIKLARWCIRYIARQRGDDRCWIDDYQLYLVVLGIILDPDKFPRARCMSLCRQYFCERTEQTAPVTVRVRPGDPDADLIGMDDDAVWQVWHEIYTAVQKHYNIGDGNRTAADDRELVNVLPEKPAMDQRVPVVLCQNCFLHIDRHHPDLLAVYQKLVVRTAGRTNESF